MILSVDVNDNRRCGGCHEPLQLSYGRADMSCVALSPDFAAKRRHERFAPFSRTRHATWGEGGHNHVGQRAVRLGAAIVCCAPNLPPQSVCLQHALKLVQSRRHLNRDQLGLTDPSFAIVFVSHPYASASAHRMRLPTPALTGTGFP